MREVAILGVAMTKFGISEKTNLEMFAEAGIEAMSQSNLGPKDMEALYFGNCIGDFEEGQMHMAPFAHAELGLPTSSPAVRFESACATATVAIRHAALLVGSGFYDVVLAGGTERACIMGTPLATKTFAMGHHAQYESTAGLTFPGVFAMAAHQLVYDDPEAAPIRPENLLCERRYDDKGNDLWTSFNVIQENIMKGGIAGSKQGANGRIRRVKTRPVKSIDRDVKLNKALWVLTEEMAKLKGH